MTREQWNWNWTHGVWRRAFLLCLADWEVISASGKDTLPLFLLYSVSLSMSSWIEWLRVVLTLCVVIQALLVHLFSCCWGKTDFICMAKQIRWLLKKQHPVWQRSRVPRATEVVRFEPWGEPQWKLVCCGITILYAVNMQCSYWLIINRWFGL